MTDTIETRIRDFIEENFLFREDRAEIGATDSLLEAGLVDSTGVLELVAFLEDTFGIVVADAEMIPENLDSIASLAAFAARKTQAVGADAA